MIKAVIFDWDGLLANTEPMWSLADKQWLAEVGIDYNDELKQKLIGTQHKEATEILVKHFNLSTSVEEAIKLRIARLKSACINAPDLLMPGVPEILQAAKQLHLKTAIASGNEQETLNQLVDCNGIRQYFNAIISSDLVKKGKPAPDVCLFAAKALQVKPAECIVFEDAEIGVIAAKAAGMKCVAVPSQYTLHHDFSQADMVLRSLAEANLPGIIKQKQ